MIRAILSAAFAVTCVVPNPGEAQTTSGAGRAATPGAPRGGSFGVSFQQDAPRPAPGGRPGSAGRHTPPPPPPGTPIVPPAPPSALDGVDLFRAGPRTYDPRFNRQIYPVYGGYGAYGSITDPFGYISQPYLASRPADDTDPRDVGGTGYLRLDVEPDTGRVYVDGLYMGSVSDFRRSGRALDAGPHRVEIRAEGYENHGVDVSIRANDMLSYRGTLTPVAQRAAVPPAAPKTFYVIPRCYAGDTRPRADRLPAGCRLSDLRTVPPVVAPPGRPQ